MSETRETRLRRLHMRSIRRGIKEMDLILSQWAETELPRMDEAGLDAYDALLEENDQAIYAWICGHEAAPARHAPLVARISDMARAGLRSS